MKRLDKFNSDHRSVKLAESILKININTIASWNSLFIVYRLCFCFLFVIFGVCLALNLWRLGVCLVVFQKTKWVLLALYQQHYLFVVSR